MQRANWQDIIDVQLLVRQGLVDVTELDRSCQDVLNKIGRPPHDRLLLNLSQQRFLQRYQAVRRVLQREICARTIDLFPPDPAQSPHKLGTRR
jgi:hypothetical protein